MTTLYVVTLDQRRSTGRPDLVVGGAARFNEAFGSGLELPFVRTAGDEMQALVRDPRVLVEIVLDATRTEQWWVGVGLGQIDELGETARDSRGPAFRNARVAVDNAKRRSWGCSVEGDPEALAVRLENALAMLVYLRRTRTPRGWEVADLARAGLRGKDIAARLGISKQAVSQHLRSAGFAEEQRGRELAVELLEGTWMSPT